MASAVLKERVQAVGLTWRDLVSSVAALTIIILYALYEFGSAPALISSASATSAIELVLCAGCALAAAADLHLRQQSLAGVIVRKVTTVLGTVALGAGLLGLILDNGHALEVLVVFTVLLQATGTLWHVLTMEPRTGS